MKKCSLLLLAVSVLVMSTGVAFAQIEMEAAFPGKATSGYIAPTGTGKLDFTDDGARGPAFFKTDSQGNLYLIIQGRADPTNMYLAPLPPYGPSGEGWPTVMGYFELDGSNSFKEIVLAEKNGQRYINPIVIDVNGAVLWDGSGKELLTIADMDGDNCEEIVVWLPIGPQVEMWGEKKN